MTGVKEVDTVMSVVGMGIARHAMEMGKTMRENVQSVMGMEPALCAMERETVTSAMEQGRKMTDPIPFAERQSYLIQLHPDCYLYRTYTKRETDDPAVWIAPAPLWKHKIFAGYAVGVYNRTGIVRLLSEDTFPLAIWQTKAKEAVVRVQIAHEAEINFTRAPEAQVKEIESCFRESEG